MKFIIKHEIPGRIRVHMVQPKMTFEEADILLYYLVNLENVTKAKVYERTQDAVIYYEKDRREIIIPAITLSRAGEYVFAAVRESQSADVA